MAAVNNYLAIVLDPALFRTHESDAVAKACEPGAETEARGHDLSTVPTALLEAELAARQREQQSRSSSSARENSRAAARAAFQQEAQVLADWYVAEL